MEPKVVRDGHVIQLHPRRGIEGKVLDDLRGRLGWLLSGRLMSSAVVEGPVVVVHVAAVSPVAARAAVWAALQALGASDLFVPQGERNGTTGADELLPVPRTPPADIPF